MILTPRRISYIFVDFQNSENICTGIAISDTIIFFLKSTTRVIVVAFELNCALDTQGIY